jgi:hypothetical protein
LTGEPVRRRRPQAGTPAGDPVRRRGGAGRGDGTTPAREPLWRRGRSAGQGTATAHVVGDSHKGPLITGEKPISSQNNRTQTNSQTVNYTSCNHVLVRVRSPRPKPCQEPIKRTTSTPLERTSASLDGRTPPQANLRLAQGLAPPSGESPPH